MLHALTTLWPKNEPRPHLEAFKTFEWCCTTGEDPCGYGATQEEALYRYAMICRNFGGEYGDQFNGVIDFLGDHVDDPLFIQSNP
jgi:hypothetical protein